MELSMDQVGTQEAPGEQMNHPEPSYWHFPDFSFHDPFAPGCRISALPSPIQCLFSLPSTLFTSAWMECQLQS